MLASKSHEFVTVSSAGKYSKDSLLEHKQSCPNKQSTNYTAVPLSQLLEPECPVIPTAFILGAN